MDATFVWKLAKLGRIGSRHLHYDDDFTDRLNYQYTGVLLFLFISIIGIRQFVGKPIQCWNPQEFTRGWEEYAENICWISNTYFSSIKRQLANPKIRNNLMIKYYQWAWVILGVQALFFYLPCLIWRGIYNRSRFDIRKIIQLSNNATDTVIPMSDKGSASTSNNGVYFIAKYIDSIIRRRHIGKCKNDISKLSNNKKSSHQNLSYFCCGHPAGNCLTILYLFVKLIYIINSISQIYIIEIFIGTKYTFYGINVLIDLIKGKYWTHTGHFPRVTFCDFEAKKLGKNYKYTLQCVLPINMILEKIFIILWFWMAMIAIINIFSLLSWSIKLLHSKFRIQFIRKHLNIMDNLASSDRLMRRHFVEQYLGADVVFIIRLISLNNCEFVASQLTNELWIIYRHRKHVELDDLKYGQMSLNSCDKAKLASDGFNNNNRYAPSSAGVNLDDIV